MDKEYPAWYQRNKIVPETETSLPRIRSSQPVRKVRGRASNVSGLQWHETIWNGVEG